MMAEAHCWVDVVEAALGHVFGYENFLRNSVLRVSRPSNPTISDMVPQLCGSCRGSSGSVLALDSGSIVESKMTSIIHGPCIDVWLFPDQANQKEPLQRIPM